MKGKYWRVLATSLAGDIIFRVEGIERLRIASRLALVASFLLLVFMPIAMVCAQHTSSPDVAALVGEARSLWNKGERERAFATLRKAIHLDPRHLAAHVELASLHMELGENDPARSAVTEALKIAPHDAAAHQRLGELLRRAGDRDGAMREAKIALSLKPPAEVVAAAHLTLGFALSQRKGSAAAANEFRAAVDEFHKALRLQPTNGFIHRQLGNALVMLRRYEEAEAAYRRALELVPCDFNAHHNLGVVLQNQGRIAEASRFYQDHLRLHPHAKDRTDVERQIQWLQTTPLPQVLGSLLGEAAQDGDTAQVQSLLDKGADVNFKTNAGSPLRRAARAGHLEVVKRLLAHGATDDDGAAVADAYENGHAEIEKLLECAASQLRTPQALNRLLFAAIRKGDIAKVEAMLTAGADAKDAALLEAVQDKPLLVVRDGAFVAVEDKSLRAAHDKALVGIVPLLIDQGANVNQPNSYKTVLMHAAGKGHLVLVKLLLAKGATVNTRTQEGTALTEAVRQGRKEIVKWLLTHGADVTAKDVNGRSALIWAAGSTLTASSEILRMLLVQGAEVDAPNQWEETALMAANSADKVKRLVAHGAVVNAQDKWGRTALMQAARRGDAEVVEALLRGGADVNVQDEKGTTALLDALASERDAAQKAKKAPAKIVLLLLRAPNLDVNAHNDNGETALMRAARRGNVEIVRRLLARGADMNATDVLGNTAFVFAYEKGDPEIESLLQNAAPPRQTPAVLNAFLRAAIRKKDAARVKDLLVQGADANDTFSIGYGLPGVKDTVLVLAAKVGHAGIVQMLLDQGADVNVKGLVFGSESGIKMGTALEAAEYAQHPDVVALLSKATSTKK